MPRASDKLAGTKGARQLKLSSAFNLKRKLSSDHEEAQLRRTLVNAKSAKQNFPGIKELPVTMIDTEPVTKTSPPPAQSLSEKDIAAYLSDPIYSKALDEMLGTESTLSVVRFHQENLNVVDKLLLQFDLTTAYGPCGGITRLARWKRAEKLKKSPHPAVKKALETPLGELDRYKFSYIR